MTCVGLALFEMNNGLSIPISQLDFGFTKLD